MEQIGTLETICRYPVKSMAGEEVVEAFVGYGGLLGDRVFGFIRTGGMRGFPWHTAREQEDLVKYLPRFTRIAPAEMGEIDFSLALGPGVNPVLPAIADFDAVVTTPDGRVLPVQSPELAAELERRGGAPVRLHCSERSLNDCRPVSLFGNTTVRGLAAELGRVIDRRRFRANFYADWQDDRPFREDELVGHALQVGDKLRLLVLERDPRCKMITIDPDTGETAPDIHRHVMVAHEGMAGVYAAVLREGVVRQGDPIYLA
jgi:MOSC domain-containing protein